MCACTQTKCYSKAYRIDIDQIDSNSNFVIRIKETHAYTVAACLN